jgi:uncharacterized membrane protein
MSTETPGMFGAHSEPLGELPPERATPGPTANRRGRLDSIDLLRGLIMALMVLDHTRDFFTRQTFDPTDLTRSTPALFFTRWVTHFCAPVFVFLAGAGAWLWASRGRSRTQLAEYLATRGLWLIFLELTVVRFGLMFNVNYQTVPLTVLWAIGWSMLALAVLVFLPMPVIAALGLVMIAGHNLLDGLSAADLGLPGWLWAVLHQQAPVPLDDKHLAFVAYPLIPWIGVMAAGYAFGGLLQLEPERRRRMLLCLGFALTCGFIALRASNVYGDPRPWAVQSTPLSTFMSFLNCQKYPPSLLYLLMTLGPALALLAFLDRPLGPLTRPLVTFGRVPLFFFLLQWPLLHTFAIVLAIATGRPYAWLFGNGPFNAPPGYGFSLATNYVLWIVILMMLYPPCAWFAKLKERRRDGWLTYL